MELCPKTTSHDVTLVDWDYLSAASRELHASESQSHGTSDHSCHRKHIDLLVPLLFLSPPFVSSGPPLSFTFGIFPHRLFGLGIHWVFGHVLRELVEVGHHSR